MARWRTVMSERSLSVVAGLWVLYLVSFPIGHSTVLNDMYVAVAVIPTVATGHLLGVRAARVVALLFYPLHVLVFLIEGHPVGIELLAGVEGALAMLVIPMMGLYAGHTSDLRRRLEEVDAARDRFIATVAHDVKNPLTGVIGLSIALRDEPDLAPDLRELAALVVDEAHTAAAIVEDLSVTALRKSGQFQAHPEVFDVAQEAWAACRAHPEIAFESEGEVRAFADRRRVRQILNNLVSNALRHGAPPVDVCVFDTSMGPVVEVTDRGDGIPPEAVDDLFEPFGMVGVSGHVESTGLGLSSSRVLATVMGGDLDYVRSQDATTFRLTLPPVSTRLRSRPRAPQATG